MQNREESGQKSGLWEWGWVILRFKGRGAESSCVLRGGDRVILRFKGTGQFTNFIPGVVWALVGMVLRGLGLKCDN